jgi:O-antigen/teichoic acid export membrane protein
MTSELLRSGAIYTAANFLSAGVPFLLLPILTRALPPHEYGRVISFFMIVPLCGALAGLGLQGAVGVRWLAQEKGNPRTYTSAAMFVVCASTLLAAALAALLGELFEFGLSRTEWALAAVTSGAMSLQAIRFSVWQSRGQALPAATLQVVSSVSNILMSLVGVLMLHLGAAGRIGGAAMAGLLIAAISVLAFRNEGIHVSPSAKEGRELLRFGLPLLPHVAAGVILSSVDRFAVSAQMGSEALGIYGVAAQIGLVMSVLADAATKAYTPTLYRFLGRTTLRGRLRVVGLTYLSIPFWLLIAFAAWGSLLLLGGALLGRQYVGALHLSIWFLIGGALSGIYMNVAALFFFTGRTEWISASTLTAAGVAALLAPWAVTHGGLAGGAATYVAAQGTLLVAAWALSLRVYPMPWRHLATAVRMFLRSAGAQTLVARRRVE